MGGLERMLQEFDLCGQKSLGEGEDRWQPHSHGEET